MQLYPLFCPTKQNRFGKAEIFLSLFNPIPTVHGVVFHFFPHGRLGTVGTSSSFRGF